MLLLAALLLATTLSAGGGRTDDDLARPEHFKQARSHYDRGLKYWQDGKTDKARKEALACLEVYPSFAEAHLLLARLDYVGGEFASALREIDAACAGYTQFESFYLQQFQDNMNQLRNRRQRKEENLRALNESLTAAPMTQAEKMRIESQIQSETQELNALDLKLREPVPSIQELPAEYHFVRGNILFKLRRAGEARDAYQAAIRADPRHGNAYNNLVNLFYVAGDGDSARQAIALAEKNGVTVNEKLKQAVLAMK
jgi:tetratricopeptide (TPR) repeat protein